MYALAAVLRAALIVYGEWQDATMAVKYTDVDYRVYTDAARLVSEGASPYDRATYRYTPLLAAAMVPNVLLHPGFGKVVFVAADLLTARLMERVLAARGVTNAAWVAGWLFNPLVFTVSTRGNADVLVCAAVMACLAWLAEGRVAAAAAAYGLATHLKIYPAVYAPGIALLLLGRRWRRAGVRRLLVFAAVAGAVFFGLGAACYALYGHDFLHETYLYHVTRRDHRHNFSPYFYVLYLGADGGGAAASLLYFVPQLAVVLAAAARYGREWPEMCLAVQTMAFVAFNKVVTAQYFVWYSAYLPLVAPFLGIGWRRAAAMAAAWLAAELHWLFWAYRLEFLGQAVFLGVWAAGLAFFAVNVWVMLELVGAKRRRRLGGWAWQRVKSTV